MKRLILPLAAVLCGSFSASAIDATDARLWMENNAKVEVRTWNNARDINGSTWQYVTFPVQVEGVVKGGDTAPHFIPEMKVHVYVLVAVNAREKEYALLDKELNYAEIPLDSKHADKNKGNGTVKVGVFVSPANAYRLAPKDGHLAKKVVAVAVEATFKDAPCVRHESGNRSIVQQIVLDSSLDLKNNWWRKKDGFKSDCGAALNSLAETPYAAQYIQLDMPQLNPIYGGGAAATSTSSTTTTSTTGGTSTSDSDSGGPTTVTDSGSADGADATDDDASKGGKKPGRRNRTGRRSRN